MDVLNPNCYYTFICWVQMHQTDESSINVLLISIPHTKTPHYSVLIPFCYTVHHPIPYISHCHCHHTYTYYELIVLTPFLLLLPVIYLSLFPSLPLLPFSLSLSLQPHLTEIYRYLFQICIHISLTFSELINLLFTWIYIYLHRYSSLVKVLQSFITRDAEVRWASGVILVGT